MGFGIPLINLDCCMHSSGTAITGTIEIRFSQSRVFGLATAHAVDVSDVFDRTTVDGQWSVVSGEQLLNLGQTEDACLTMAELPFRRLVGIEAGGHNDGTHFQGNSASIREAYFGGEITYSTTPFDQFGLGE